MSEKPTESLPVPVPAAVDAVIGPWQCPPELREVQTFDQLQRVAKMYAKLPVVPQAFKGDIGNCVVACSLAMQLGVPVLMLMQNLYLVHGRVGMQAQLAIALANARNVLGGRIHYEFERGGDSLACTAYAIDEKTGLRSDFRVDMETAKANGWLNKKDSKWHTLPELMLRYRAAMFLIRTHAPEAICGALSAEEIQDMTHGGLASAGQSKIEALATSLPDAKPPLEKVVDVAVKAAEEPEPEVVEVRHEVAVEESDDEAPWDAKPESTQSTMFDNSPAPANALGA